MQLYYHKTDGGAEYLMDTFIQCPNSHKEGTINKATKYIVRIDGDITKDAELDVRPDEKFLSDVRQVIDYTLENEQKHWEENDKPRAHIYCNARRADKELKKLGIN